MPNISMGIDHPLVTVRDHSKVIENYRRLGFSPTGVSYHPWGTKTSLVMFADNFIELIGVEDSSKFGAGASKEFCFGRYIGDFIARDEGISLVALHSRDGQGDHSRLHQAGLASQGVIEFRRKMVKPDGSPDEAVVSLGMFLNEEDPDVSHFICHQHRPELIWVPEWQNHPNGARAIAAATYRVSDPSKVCERYQKFYGPDAVSLSDGMVIVDTGCGLLRFADEACCRRLFPETKLPERSNQKAASCIALTIAALDLGAVRDLWKKDSIEFQEGRDGALIVGPEDFGNTILEFVPLGFQNRSFAAARKNAVGVVGLGNMGRGMALSLARSGFCVLGSDLSDAARESVVRQGIEATSSIRQLCEVSDVIVLSLPDARAVADLVEGEDKILAHMRPGTIIVDTTTSNPEVTRRLAKLIEAKGGTLLDAPVSGGAKAANSGTLTMVIGGPERAVVVAAPILQTMSAKRMRVGESGAGHVVKIANNLLCAAHLVTAAEAVAIARKAGLEPSQLIDAINFSSGRSGVTQVNFPTWILNGAFNSGFTMKLMRKDVRLAANLWTELGLSLPLSEEVARLWALSEEYLDDAEDFNRIVGLPNDAEVILLT